MAPLDWLRVLCCCAVAYYFKLLFHAAITKSLLVLLWLHWHAVKLIFRQLWIGFPSTKVGLFLLFQWVIFSKRSVTNRNIGCKQYLEAYICYLCSFFQMEQDILNSLVSFTTNFSSWIKWIFLHFSTWAIFTFLKSCHNSADIAPNGTDSIPNGY